MRTFKKSIYIGGLLIAFGLFIAPLPVVVAAPSERAQQVGNSQSPQGAVSKARKSSDDTAASERRAVAQAKVVRQEKVRVACERRQQTVENRVRAFSGSADKHLTRLNAVFDKIVKLKEDNSLTVANYETALSDVVARQEAARSAVSALKGLADSVDCNRPETAVQLSTTKDAASKTRDDLKEYKASLKVLLGAITQATASAPVLDKAE